eukprot:2023794-Rhodomonas_salina.1
MCVGMDFAPLGRSMMTNVCLSISPSTSLLTESIHSFALSVLSASGMSRGSYTAQCLVRATVAFGRFSLALTVFPLMTTLAVNDRTVCASRIALRGSFFGVSTSFADLDCDDFGVVSGTASVSSP